MCKAEVVTVFIGVAYAALAQGDRGTITGTIADQASAVVAGATIQAKNVETGGVYEAASSDTGNFTLSQLPAGAYEISSAAPSRR